MKYIYFSIIFVLMTLLGTFNSNAQTNFNTRDIATNLDTPWEILWGPDNFIWMTERYGRISRVNPQTGEVIEYLRINEVSESGERGLMGMALHPQFISPVPEIQAFPYIYVVYNYNSGTNSRIKVVRYNYNNGNLESKILLNDIPGAQFHDGARIWIDERDWTLYVSIGDATIASNAQNLSNNNGKILRMNLDGTIPNNNPYPNSYIWSWGLRNSQGLVFANNKLYSSEHGPENDDEVNIIQKGRNYGWPNVMGYCNLPAEKTFCEANLVVEPIAAWTPTIAPAGMDYYNNNLIPDWKNSILLTTLKASKLIQLKLDATGTQVEFQKDFFTSKFGRLRDICISPDGKVYIATSNKDGRGSPGAKDDRIIEITPLQSSIDELKKNDGIINAYPNPFTNEVLFENLPDFDCIEIYNLYGDKVRILINKSTENLLWNGRDDAGFTVPNGIYFAKIKTGTECEIIKLSKH
ncbi:MAG: glucose dehydrogenase [Ignavibacteria bacterium]|nr:glucose dehydrogenase [Ignavibacteria bacterium]